ncbi:MAG TPA: SMC-Scp complex subunit ScpB [Clostridia bacterium]|nr:SMC-Scp complex subunit ScpB [Clostridia bacterium]
MLFSDELKAILECLLFASNGAVSAKELASVVGVTEQEVEELIAALMDDYGQSGRGIQIYQVAGGYKMATKPDYAEYIEKLCRHKPSPLSKAALETLAIIAYRQPVTRAEIEAIRGVKVDHLLSNLLEKNLIQEVGRKETPGRPILYGTTTEFLEYLGLNSIEDLPPLEDQD